MLGRVKLMFVALSVTVLMFAGTVSSFAADPAAEGNLGACVAAHAVLGPADAIAMHNAHHPDEQVSNFGQLVQHIQEMHGEGDCPVP